MATSTKQFAFSDLSVEFGGKVHDGVTEMEWTEKQEKEPLYGRGNKPHGIVRGNKSYEGKIKMWQSLLEEMIKDAPDNDVLDLEFDVIMNLARTDDVPMVTDIAVNVQITEVKKGLAQGDKMMEIELPIIFTDIKRQQ